LIPFVVISLPITGGWTGATTVFVFVIPYCWSNCYIGEYGDIGIMIMKKQKGFTLIELLVVIAIIGLLVTIVLVALDSAKKKARDVRRIADLRQIQIALEMYINKNDTLPIAYQYGERNVSPGWWDGWWDLSSGDGDGDGIYFLDFLVDDGILKSVPVDPLNDPADYNGYPYRNVAGHRYVYIRVTSNYSYQGGSCVYRKANVYMLGISDLEYYPSGSFNSGCECLWQDRPNMFQNTFDYIICGIY